MSGHPQGRNENAQFVHGDSSVASVYNPVRQGRVSTFSNCFRRSNWAMTSVAGVLDAVPL